MFTTTGAFFAHDLVRINGRKYRLPERCRIAPSFWLLAGALLAGAAALVSWLAAH